MQNNQLAPNYYHRWGYIDEINDTINHNIESTAKQHHLPPVIIKIARALTIINNISDAIADSFLHPHHPEQIDDMKKTDWLGSVANQLNDWHSVFHAFMANYLAQPMTSFPDNYSVNTTFLNNASDAKQHLTHVKEKWNEQHTKLIIQLAPDADWKKLCNTNPIEQITNDFSLDDIKMKYAYIEPFFRGIHQIFEATMTVMMDVSHDLRHQLSTIKIDTQQQIEKDETAKITTLRKLLHVIQLFWEVSAKHVMLLSKMDTGSYAEYRQALLGTSGGDSKQLRELKQQMTTLQFCLPKELQSQELFVTALKKHPNDVLLNQLLSSIRETQAAAIDFWMRHFTLTANTIGIIRGSQGLPVEKLLAFAVSPIMKSDSLLKSVGEVGNQYAKHPEAMLVEINQQQKVIGKTIYAHIKKNVKLISEMSEAIEIAHPVLDHFELRPLELNDTQQSPYASWFDADVHTPTLRFAMHSFGTPLSLFQDSLAKSAHRLMEAQNDYWKIYFSERWPQFRTVLFNTLSIPQNAPFAISIDVNITSLLERLLSTFTNDSRNIIVTSHHEFIAINRTLASFTHKNDVELLKASFTPDMTDLSQPLIEAIDKAGNQLKCVIFSQVMSNTQLSMTGDEIENIIQAVPEDVPVFIDGVQGMFNVPTHWGNILKNRRNVYVLGSAIKHGRSSSGLGFLIYPESDGLLQHPSQSGWCAYQTGLTIGRTTDDQGHLLYDKPWQWLGATPGNIFALDLFINTWDAIARAGETIASMHAYTQSILKHFISHLPKQQFQLIDEARRDNYPLAASNAISLAPAQQPLESILKKIAENRIAFDYRDNRLRIGFGIQHGKLEAEKLIDAISEN